MKNFNKSIFSKALFTGIVTISLASYVSAQSYFQNPCDYEVMATEGTELCLGDDAVSAAIPLGFTFNFYELPFTECYISSNGYLSFESGLGSGCCTGQILPTGTFPHSIFFAQEDLDPNTCVDGTITYYTTGAPGSQIFVLSFVDVPHYPGPEGTFPVSVQVQLYEGTDEVRIVTTEYNGDGGLSTMGLNEDATNADVVPGRNSQDWSAAEECISFVPSGLPDAGCTDPAALNYDPTAEVDDGSCVYGYDYTVCDYDLMPTEGTVVCLGDDATSAAIPLGFTFHYYDMDFTEGYIKSNGAFAFSNYAGSLCCTGQILPNASYTYTIFMGQEDLDPNTCVDGEINYYTTGDPGNQVFVVNFLNVPHYPGPGDFDVSMQLQLYEATGEIRIELTNWPSDGGAATCGLNWNGLYAQPAPDKNSTVWSATSECHSWLPAGFEPVCAVPAGLFADGITDNDAVLHWDSIDGATQYRLWLLNTFTGATGKKSLNTNSYTITDILEPLTTYGFRVKSICYDIEMKSAFSEWYYFTTLGRLGAHDATVSMYPNPTSGAFTLQLNGLEDATFQLAVFDALGTMVYSESLQVDNTEFTTYINLENVSSGMYQVKLMNSDVHVTYPIVIQK